METVWDTTIENLYRRRLMDLTLFGILSAGARKPGKRSDAFDYRSQHLRKGTSVGFF